MSNYVTRRSLLLSNIENMLENIVARRQHNNNASQDLFGDSDDDNLIKIQLKEDTLRLTQLEIAQKEKESLGVYMHGNPLSEYEDLIKLLNTIIKGRNIYLVIVQKIRKVFTRAHTLMYALELTTIDGDYEGVIYSKNASLYSSILEEKSLYWATGNINDPSKKQVQKIAKEEIEMDADNPTPEQLEITVEYTDSPKIVIDHIELYDSGVAKFLAGITTRPPETSIIDWSKSIDWKLDPKSLVTQIKQITPPELLKAKTTKYKSKAKTNYGVDEDYEPEYQPENYDENSITLPSDYTNPKKITTKTNYKLVELILRSTSNITQVKAVKSLLHKEDPDDANQYYRVSLSVDKAGIIQKAKKDFYILKSEYDKLGEGFR